MTVGGFIQDSWSVMDKVTVNLGLRYDSQYFYNTAGNVGLSLPNQWSPRLGLIYDPTQTGKAKMYVNYARYYENAPLGFADVVLVGEPQVRGGHACNPQIFSQQRDGLPGSGQPAAPTASRPRGRRTGSSPPAVWPARWIPDIEASSSDELSGGAEYELFPDTRLGLALNRRWINKWIEDLGPVVGLNGFAGNPGYGLGGSLPQGRAHLPVGHLVPGQELLAVLAGPGQLHAGVAARELPGSVRPRGRLPRPQRHRRLRQPQRVQQPLRGAQGRHPQHPQGDGGQGLAASSGATAWAPGLSFRARSGAPTSYLGADPFTYPTESYLAARGSGPRLPWLFTADLQLAYRVAAFQGVGLSVTADVFNLFNWQRHVAVDEEYTTDNVVATEGFKPGDLATVQPGQTVPNLQNDAGEAVTRKDGFGRAHCLSGAARVPLRHPGGILMTSQRSDRSFGILATSALVLLSPLWLSCDAIQPRPPCRAQMQKYAAKYTMVGSPTGNCAGKIPTAEVLNMQYYRTKPNDNSVAPTLAIEAQSVFDAVTEAKEKMTAVTRHGVRHGLVRRVRAGRQRHLQGGHADRVDRHHRGEEVRLQVEQRRVHHQAADELDPLRRRSGPHRGRLQRHLKVSAIYPAIYCGTGKKMEPDGMGGTHLVDDPPPARPTTSCAIRFRATTSTRTSP